ncbi:MAG: hypothetical protein ACI81R_002137 [Bradymonadia bacterium]|jgi:hypothetical protein
MSDGEGNDHILVGVITIVGVALTALLFGVGLVANYYNQQAVQSTVGITHVPHADHSADH